MASYGDSSIYADYSQGAPESKQDMKELLDQMLAVMIDFSECYAKTSKAMNHPQHANLRVNERLGPRIKNWNNEIKNANMNHRRNLNRLMSDIRYIIGSMDGSDNLFKELEQSSKPLKDHWDSNRVSPNPNMSKHQVDDILKILGVPPSLTYVQQPPVQNHAIQQNQTRPPQQMAHQARPGPQESLQQTPAVQRVYYIDPVTGQKVEMLDSNQPRNSVTRIVDSRNAAPTPIQPSPNQSNVISQNQYSNPQTRVIRQDQQPPTRIIRQENQPESQTRVIRADDLQPNPYRGTPPANNTSQVPSPPHIVQQEPQEYDYASRRQLDDRQLHQTDKVRQLEQYFGGCRETKIEVDDQPTKIEVSQDGDRVYYGGESFGMLEYDPDGFIVPHGRIFSNRVSDINPIKKSTGSQSPDSKFKNSHSGDVLIGELIDWNVYLYDSELQELGKLSSKQGSMNRLPSTYPQFKTTSAKPYACLWYSGNQNISEVDTGTYVNQEINNFWIMKNKPVEPLGAHLSKNGDIVGIGQYQGVQNSLHFYSPKTPSTVLAYDRPDIFPYCKSWQAIDGHQNGQVFYIGGSSNPDQNNETAYLIALSLDENMEVLRYREFPPATGHDTIKVIKTYPDDLMLVATNKSIMIVNWINDQFVVIKQIPSTSPVFDCVLSQTNQYVRAPIIYALMKDGTCSAYNLGKERDTKSIMAKPTRRNKKVYDMGTYMSTPKTGQGKPYDPTSASKLQPEERLQLKKAPAKHANLYKEYNLKQIMIQNDGLGRVQAPENEQFVYCGQNDLKILENRSEKYALLNANHPVKPFADIYLLPGKTDLIVLERLSGDLVKYDSKMTETQRLKGSKPIQGPGSEFTTYIYAGSMDKYLWAPGENSLAIVNPNNFTSSTVQNFFGKQGESTMPLTAMGNKDYSKFVGIYLTKDDQMLSMLDINSGIIRKRVSEINPRVPFFYSLENSYLDENIFFAGGTTNRDAKKGSAVIQAITCDKNLACIDELELKAGDNIERCTVGWLTRAKDKDVLFAAVNQAVFVVEWTGTHFCILNYIEDVHSKLPITLCSPNPIRIYTSSMHDGYINRIDFKAY